MPTLDSISKEPFLLCKPYQQYAGSVALSGFFECVNDYVVDLINSFYQQLELNLNLDNKTDYAFFWLNHYLGMVGGFDSVLQTTSINKWDKGTWDSGQTWDGSSKIGSGDGDNDLKFTSLIIAKWSLNRNYPVPNIAYYDLLVQQLHKEIGYKYTPDTHPQTSRLNARYESVGNKLTIHLPNDNAGYYAAICDIMNSSDNYFFGMPAGKIVDFKADL